MRIRDVLYGSFPEAWRAFEAGLDSAVWPEEAVDAVATLREFNEYRITSSEAVATAPTEEAFDAELTAREEDYYARVAAGTWNSQANALRAILGLPLGPTE